MSSSLRKTFLICKLGLVMYRDSAHSPQYYGDIKGDVVVQRKTFLILNLELAFKALGGIRARPYPTFNSWYFEICRRPGVKPH
jgi:hypothetical protein